MSSAKYLPVKQCPTCGEHDAAGRRHHRILHPPRSSCGVGFMEPSLFPHVPLAQGEESGSCTDFRVGRRPDAGSQYRRMVRLRGIPMLTSAG